MSATTTSTDFVLALKDGTVISGVPFGADTAMAGECVFATGMTGYPESLTDPSFAGQILVLTYPMIGSYGVPGDELDQFGLPQNFESSKVQIAGLVVTDYVEGHSHAAAIRSLGDWLKQHNIPAIHGVDTRMLTQHLRETGNQPAKLGPRAAVRKLAWRDIDREHLVAQVSVSEPQFYQRGPKTVAILDCGMKLGILRNFLERDISVWRLPHDHDLSGIEFDGLFISNGPGDPKMAKATIATIRRVMEKQPKTPIFGICLGNQLLALASGMQTARLPYGHRSHNQPVRDTRTGRCFVTSQNHGYAVQTKMKPGWKVLFENINDLTVEGLIHEKNPWFSVQFHPEACPGPVDAGYLFDDFIARL